MGNLERTECHEPYQLNTPNKRKHIVSVVKKAIDDGLDVEDGFVMAGIPVSTYRRWRREAVEDWKDGFTGTNLQNVMMEIAQADINFHRKLRRAMFKKVEEGDTRMMMYLEDNRFGASNKRKQNIEVGTKTDNNIQINITPMTGVETDEEPPIDVKGEVKQDNLELE